MVFNTYRSSAWSEPGFGAGYERAVAPCGLIVALSGALRCRPGSREGSPVCNAEMARAGKAACDPSASIANQNTPTA